MEELVSVIIPTYNRFNYLLNTIDYVKSQTYKNIEIIVVNDCSTQKEYYEYDWGKEGVVMINLPENSKKKFGFSCAGGGDARNIGIEKSSGDYVAFCDDDDIWLPNKIELQLQGMKKTGCKMSSTDGFIGNGVYDSKKKYKKYNEEHFYEILKNIYRRRRKLNLFLNAFEKGIWNRHFLTIHNCMICSSVIISKEIIDKTGKFIIAKNSEDYQYWLRALEHTDSVYIKEPCFYYDSGHGDGQNY